ncbi:sigma factor-like helix-turn-helix DNA-binding protein [Pedobacter cryoconitis]|uniref:DNA-directed RNA polymerase specialized sigma24 family protein n=1 Tax=Pedobacter cryoconitis TaxID=188932 RepID=A0A7X0JAB4_9SPHI|nr:DNA-directed RNA polymerase specialized sigma24 family protein [Pedobacter cryoconitis]
MIEEVERLPEKCRIVFKYSREGDLAVKGISEKVNISTGTVENHMNKALIRLGSKMEILHQYYFIFFCSK